MQAKFDLSEVDEAMFPVVARRCELIFSLLTKPKYVFSEVEKAKFHVVARHGEHISFLSTCLKFDVSEVRKLCCKGSRVTLNSFSVS